MSDNYSDDQDGLSTSSPTSIEFGDIEEKLTNVVEFSQQRISKRHRVNRSTGESSRISERINESLKNGHSSTLEEKFLDRNITAVFLQKTFVMINECDPSICSWSQDGEKFIVKDPELLAKNVIPKYFGHNKFSSFSRQLNFYGFKKLQVKPIRNSDMDPETAKHIIFMNENFKRGREDLLVHIHRSTRGTMTHHATKKDQDTEIKRLRQKVDLLEEQIKEMSDEFKRKFLNLETSFASILQISSGQLQQRTHALHQSLYNESSNQPMPHSYPSTVEHSSMGASADTRIVSYFGDLGNFEEMEFQDFFI